MRKLIGTKNLEHSGWKMETIWDLDLANSDKNFTIG